MSFNLRPIKFLNKIFKSVSLYFSKFSSISKFLKHASWSFIGIIITIIITIIIFHLSKVHYDFQITIDSEINLVEVRENIEGLEIFFKGEDILKSNKEIKIIILTMRNKGETILQDYFDINQPFGLKFHNTTLLSAEIKNSNSVYLENSIFEQSIIITNNDIEVDNNQFNPKLPKSNELFLSKIIFDKEKFITFKIYLLCPANSESTQISFIGKIANIEEIRISKNQKPS